MLTASAAEELCWEAGSAGLTAGAELPDASSGLARVCAEGPGWDVSRRSSSGTSPDTRRISSLACRCIILSHPCKLWTNCKTGTEGEEIPLTLCQMSYLQLGVLGGDSCGQGA